VLARITRHAATKRVQRQMIHQLREVPRRARAAVVGSEERLSETRA
jgi:hypothetical protein